MDLPEAVPVEITGGCARVRKVGDLDLVLPGGLDAGVCEGADAPRVAARRASSASWASRSGIRSTWVSRSRRPGAASQASSSASGAGMPSVWQVPRLSVLTWAAHWAANRPHPLLDRVA